MSTPFGGSSSRSRVASRGPPSIISRGRKGSRSLRSRSVAEQGDKSRDQSPRSRGDSRRQRNRQRHGHRKKSLTDTMVNPENIRKPTPSRDDKIFIIVVWTTEVVKTILIVFEDRITFDKSLATESGTKKYSLILIVQTVILCVSMICVCMFVYIVRKVRLPFLIGGLTLYLLLPMFGLLFAFYDSQVYSTLMMTFSCLWWLVHPIRFLLIFHQFYPIRMLNARRLVTTNFIIIWAVEFLASYILYARRVGRMTYVIGWTMSTICLIAWIIGLILVRKKRNKKPDELLSKTEEYQRTEVRLRFHRNQLKLNITLLTFLMVSYLIFPMLKMSLKIIRILIGRKLRGRFDFLVYRLDLIITIILALLLEFLSSALEKRRNEKYEMVVIAGTLIFNIFFLILLKPAVPRMKDLDQPDQFELGSIARVHLVGFPLDSSEPDTFLRVNEIESPIYKADEDYESGPWSNMQIDLFTLDEETVPLQVVSSSSGKVLFEQEIKIYRDELMVYMYHYEGPNSPTNPNFKGKLVLFDIDIWDRWTENKFYILTWNNNIPECHDGYDEAGIKELNNSKAWSWEGSYSIKVDIRKPGQKDPRIICFPFKPVLFYPISEGVESAAAKVPLKFPKGKGELGVNELPCSNTEEDYLCVPVYGVDLSNDFYSYALEDRNLVTLNDHTHSLCQLAATSYTGPDYPASYVIWYWNIESSVERGVPVCFARPIFLIHEGRTEPAPPVVTTPISSTLLYGLASVGVVSYIVLLWIFSPIKWRPFLLFAFFMYEVVCEQGVKILVVNMTEKVWKILLFFAVFALASHVSIVAVWLWRIKIPEEEREDQDKRY